MRHYPSEHQDWEQPHWPHHILAGEEPGQDPELELPPDPFPDWHSFTGWQKFLAADTDDQGWPGPLGDPFPECVLFQRV